MLECLLCLAVSPYFSTYESTIRSEPGVSVSIGDPLYFSVSYEAPDLKIVGQHVPTKSVGASVGYSQRVSDEFRVFLEAGYYWPSASPLDVVKNEIVEQVLINDHGEPPFHPAHFEYDLEPGWGGRVGFEIQATKRLSVFGAYRFLKFNEYFGMCNFEEACAWDATGDARYWQNRGTRDYSSIQIGFSIRI